MDSDARYLQRRQAEIGLLTCCLTAAEQVLPSAPHAALERKLHLAAQLRAVQCLQHWAVTETARHPSLQRHEQARTFRYNYQRADLQVKGAPVYPGLHAPTLYSSCGMSAIHSLLFALLQLNARLEIRIAGADLPVAITERVAGDLAAWWRAYKRRAPAGPAGAPTHDKRTAMEI